MLEHIENVYLTKQIFKFTNLSLLNVNDFQISVTFLISCTICRILHFKDIHNIGQNHKLSLSSCGMWFSPFELDIYVNVSKRNFPLHLVQCIKHCTCKIFNSASSSEYYIYMLVKISRKWYEMVQSFHSNQIFLAFAYKQFNNDNINSSFLLLHSMNKQQ